ncbi:MAG: glutamine synthetase, partial [Rhodobacteraceae bacterium]|nr:glutamine synthetase [Paracoccaceae bacterium]
MNPQAPMAWLEGRPAITSLRAAVCDLNGILRGKRVPVAQAHKVLEGQMRMPYSITCLDIWGEDVAGNPIVYKQGDIDGRCEPTG